MQKSKCEAKHRADLYSDGMFRAHVSSKQQHSEYSGHMGLTLVDSKSFGALSLSCDYLKLSAEKATYRLATCVEAGIPLSFLICRLSKTVSSLPVSSHVPSRPQCVRQSLPESHG